MSALPTGGPAPTSLRDLLAPSSSPARILVCDDSATIRALMVTLLGRTYTVALTATAEEALARAPEFAPDLVITDQRLPGMSGQDLVRRLRATPAFEDVPIIVLTAVGDADSRADGIEAGADEYLVKPVRERELRARVASLLELRRTLLALSRRSRELEEANAALRTAQDRLVRSERLAALGSLAASLAHDINNPLSIVASGARALGDLAVLARREPPGSIPDDVARYLREVDAVAAEIAGASRRLSEIGRDLRLFGSADPATAYRILVEDSVRSAASLACSRVAEPPQVQVTVAGNPEIEAPAHLVALALLAIVDRAVFSAGPRGHVRIEVGESPEGVSIAVSDDGPSIPVALLPRVFEPFVRLDPAHETMGLGLSVAAGIVQGLGGHIDVDGRVEAGARFRIQLPVAPPSPAR